MTRADSANDRRLSFALIAALVALVAFQFHRLFTEPISILNGDSLLHALPIDHIFSELAHGQGWRFWRPDIALGFPVYAESTGAFFHPFAFALFASFDWLTAHDLLYVMSFSLTGIFAFGVARVLGLEPLAAGIAAVVVAFSPGVLWSVYNASYAHALAWSAGALWTFERWDAARSWRSLLAFGVAIGLALLAGYPPLVFATLLFAGIVAVVRALGAPSTFLARGFGLGLAATIGLGLAALQVFPLLELSANSTRQSAVQTLQDYPIFSSLLGLFVMNDPALYTGEFVYFLAPLGTMLAVLGVTLLPLQHNRFVASYIVAIGICLGAAAGPGSPFFEVFRLALPGFDRLRLLSPFVFVTIVPCGVLLAASIDAGLHAPITRSRRIACALIFAVTAAMIAFAQPLSLATRFYVVTAAALFGVSVGAVVWGRRSGRAHAALAIVLAVLVVEVLMLKSTYVRGFPDAVIEEREPLASFLRERLRDDPGARVAHLWSRSTRAHHDLIVYSHWSSPGYEIAIRSALARLLPGTNVFDAIPTLGAPDSLPLAGVPELRNLVLNELRGRSPLPPGRRWIDRLHIRYVIADVGAQVRAPDLRDVWTDPTGKISVLENPSAGAAWSTPASGALPLAVADVADGADSAALRPAIEPFAPAWLETAIGSLPFVRVERAGPIEIEQPDDGPLYVPIAAYPGWSAWIDDARVELRPDNQFGMWIDAPAGRHRVELRFVPIAFYAGVLVSVATLVGVALFAGARLASDHQ